MSDGLETGKFMIKGLHHNAYRCRDSEETRKFYEDCLGLPLANAFPIETTLTGREADVADRHYILAERNKPSIFWEEYERVSKRPGWQCYRMPTKHDVMVEAPGALADLLHGISVGR